MIQRKQTLWLIVAAVLLALTISFPMYVGTKDGIVESHLPVVNNIGYKINVYVMIIGCIAAIFLFHSRSLQKIITLCVLAYNIVISYIFCFNQMSTFSKGTLALSSLLYFAIPVFLILAIAGIYKDEKLIKSVNSNRLRD